MVRLLTDLVEEVDPLMELVAVEEMAVAVPVLTDQLLLQYQEQQILEAVEVAEKVTQVQIPMFNQVEVVVKVL